MVIWPALPSVVYGAGGSIAVVEVEQPRGDDGTVASGTWALETRTIEIERGAPQNHKWRTLFHEIMHATLADTGLDNLLNDESQEALCCAVGTARLVEMAGQLTGTP